MKKGLLTIVIITLMNVLFARLDITAQTDYPREVVGDIIYTKPLKSVIFSHKTHVTEKGLSCDMCHPEIFYPAALKAQERPDFNMESLYKGKYCGACHNGKMAFASNTQCARCHIGVKGFNTLQKMAPVKRAVSGPSELIMIGKNYTSVKFSHDTHTKSFKCVDCHSGLFHMSKGKTKVTMEEIYQRQSCGICHNGEKAFSADECNGCHTKTPAPKTDITYIVRDIGPVKFSHNFHTKTFKCADCHTKLFAMKKGGSKMNMDAMYSGKFCGTCHNGNIASPASECNKCHKG